jgi:hypothetical protein
VLWLGAVPGLAASGAFRPASQSGRDIVVLHDGSHQALGADREGTLKALGEWLPRWRDRGIRAVVLDEGGPCAPDVVTGRRVRS